MWSERNMKTKRKQMFELIELSMTTDRDRDVEYRHREEERGRLTSQRSDEWWGTWGRWAAPPTGHGLWRKLVLPDPPGRPSPGPLETTAAPARTTRSAPTASCSTHTATRSISTALWCLLGCKAKDSQLITDTCVVEAGSRSLWTV